MHDHPIAGPSSGLIQKSFLALGALLLGGTVAAQGAPPRLMVSTTADVPDNGTLPFIDDASLIAVGGAGGVLPHFIDGHWLGTSGFVPGDIDGFARLPGMVPGRGDSIAVSFLSNELGLADGDVLVFGSTGGLQVLVSEDEIVAALGLSGVAIDVDALDFDDAGRLLFSLQSDVDQTVLGLVEDGDVLAFEAGGVVSRVLSEAEIQARFTAATGSTASVGDVQALDWVAGEIWVATQGPSSHDGAILSCAAVPYVVGDEAAIGLGGAEIDALSIVEPGQEIPTILIDRIQALPGDTFHAEFHGPADSVALVLMAGDTGYVDFTTHPGWGGWYLDPLDTWLQAILLAPWENVVILDSYGYWEVDYTLPTLDLWGMGLGGEDGWSFQMVDLATLKLSAPFRVEKL